MNKHLLALLLVCLSISALTGFELIHVLATPAPNNNSLCEPGGCGQSPYDMRLYIDAGNTTVLVQDGANGGNVCSSSVSQADVAIQCALNKMAALTNPIGGHSSSTSQTAVTLFVSRGYYAISATLTWSSAFGLNIIGEGRNRSQIAAASNLVGDIIDVTGGSIIEFGFVKFLCNGFATYAVKISGTAAELNMYHVEVRDCVTAGVYLGATGVAWNSFIDVWVLGDHTGIISFVGGVRVIGSTFDGNSIAGFDVPSCCVTASGYTLSGNLFAANGGTNGIGITFENAGSLTNVNALVSGNTFYSANVAARTGVNIGNNIDNVTITGNNFIGVATPVSYGTGTRLNTVVKANPTYNPVGKITNFVVGSTFAPWGTGSAVSASTDYIIEGMDMFVTSTAGTGVSITVKDNLGNTVTGLSGLATITAQYIPSGYKINFGAFSGAPTATVFGD